ncbi:MAG: hypothetical protein SF029_02500 [bacterium]|nr:hypothetical protein [bacterium]
MRKMISGLGCTLLLILAACGGSDSATPTQGISDESGGLPVIQNGGDVPDDLCVVVHPGGDAIVPVHAQPRTDSAPIAVLGDWAEIMQFQAGWYQIALDSGIGIGWIDSTVAQQAGACS